MSEFETGNLSGATSKDPKFERISNDRIIGI